VRDTKIRGGINESDLSLNSSDGSACCEAGFDLVYSTLFGNGVWVKDTLIGFLPDDRDRRREFTDAIFNTICILTEKE
jgi:hypothetical protein